MLDLLLEGILLEQVSPESEEGGKKLVLVLITSTPATGTREEAVETAETIGKNGKESEGEYLENIARVPCIWYLIIFQKKSVPVLALFDLGIRLMPST